MRVKCSSPFPFPSLYLIFSNKQNKCLLTFILLSFPTLLFFQSKPIVRHAWENIKKHNHFELCMNTLQGLHDQVWDGKAQSLNIEMRTNNLLFVHKQFYIFVNRGYEHASSCKVDYHRFCECTFVVVWCMNCKFYT